MKNVKLVLALALFAVALAVPALGAPKAHAAEFTKKSNWVTKLECDHEQEVPSVQIEGDSVVNDFNQDGNDHDHRRHHHHNGSCDLALTKQVSVNGGAFVDADSADAAAQAKVGDSVQWKIVVTNNSDEGYTPTGTVIVHDVLPNGVTAGSSTASTGTYANGDWTFSVNESLPATLVVNSTAATVGLFENTATLTDYTPDCNDCVDPPYVDADASNNSNNAFVNIAAVPVTVGTTVTDPGTPATLVNTGVNPLLEMFTALTIAAAAVIVFNYDKVKAELVKFNS